MTILLLLGFIRNREDFFVYGAGSFSNKVLYSYKERSYSATLLYSDDIHVL